MSLIDQIWSFISKGKIPELVDWSLGGICDNIPFCHELTTLVNLLKDTFLKFLDTIVSMIYMAFSLFTSLISVFSLLLSNFYVFLMIYEVYVLIAGIFERRLTRKIGIVIGKNILLLSALFVFARKSLDITYTVLSATVNGVKSMISAIKPGG